MLDVAGAGLAPFALNEDTLALQAMAREFAAAEIAPQAVQWDQEKHFPVDVLRKAAALGMAGIYVREESGGAGLTRLDAAVVFEALAEGCPTTSAYLSIHNMVSWMVDRFAPDALRARVLPALLTMETLAAYCLTEPGSGSDAAALRTMARREGDHYVVDGVKQFISGAGAADVYAIMVRTGGEGPDGISCLLVEKGSAGLSFGPNERKMGWNAQPTAQVILEGVRVPVENRLGTEGEGFKIALAGLDGGRLNIAACSLGGAEAAFRKARDYMGERQAFGKPLADFQALQFRLADLATQLFAARMALYAGAAAFDRSDAEKTQVCAMVKRFVTDTGFSVANDALQLLGGYGYLADYGIEKIVRDLRVHQILEGTNEIMRLIIARRLLTRR